MCSIWFLVTTCQKIQKFVFWFLHKQRQEAVNKAALVFNMINVKRMCTERVKVSRLHPRANDSLYPTGCVEHSLSQTPIFFCPTTRSYQRTKTKILLVK